MDGEEFSKVSRVPAWKPLFKSLGTCFENTKKPEIETGGWLGDVLSCRHKPLLGLEVRLETISSQGEEWALYARWTLLS